MAANENAPTDEVQLDQPLDLAQARADAEEEAAAFHLSLDQLVSRYEEMLSIEHDPEPDPDADPQTELKRLRDLGSDLEQGIEELGSLERDLRDMHMSYHRMLCGLPTEGRLRAQFTTEFNRFVKDHFVSESITGTKKRIAELKSMLKQAELSHRQIRMSQPENQVNFDPSSDDAATDTEADEHRHKGPSGTARSRRTSTVPSGTASSQQPANTSRTKVSFQPQSHTCSDEQPRRLDKSSDEFEPTSSHATHHGSAEPRAANPGSPASLLGLFKSTFQSHAQKTSPPDRSSSTLRFNADGNPRNASSSAHQLYTTAVKTGADFSAYNSNPFYTNSTVKLPIRPTECVPAGTDKYPAPPPLHFKGISDTPFTGDIRSYPNWRDAFIRLVHAPGRVMQDSERLLYLKQCLKGAPLDMIDRLPINDMGYQFATLQLENRFYNPKRALFTLRQDLHAVRPPVNTYSDLLRFQQELVHICGNFLQAGEDISDNDLFTDVVMPKLPLTVRCTLSQRKRDQGDTSPWTISQLIEELQRALDIMSDAYLYEGASPHQPSGSRSRPNRPLLLEHPYGSSAERTGGAFVGAISQGPQSQSCAFCGAKGIHWSSDCTRYTSISERYDRAKELDYCFACLRKDHWRNANACRATRTCPYCTKSRHHPALCETYATKRRSEGHQPRQSGKKKKTSNRNTQRGSHSTKDEGQGRTPDRAHFGAGGPTEHGTATFHRTDHGPRQSRRPDQGRVQMHAAATGDEDTLRQTNGQAPVQDDFGGAGPYEDLQQPSGSSVADSYAYDSVHLTQTNGQDHPTKDEDQCSVVTHDSDAPTEPGMREEYDVHDPYSQQSYATAGATHFPEQPTHANFLECVMATVFHPSTRKHKRVAVFFDSGSDGTFVRQELAQELGLPNLGDSPLHLDTFAQDKPVRMDAFRTRLGFKQKIGRDIVLGLKASPKLVKSLKAVFIKPTDVALLKENQCELVPQHVVPDVLIGRDTQHLFLKRDEYPPLPNGFCLLHTTLGTIVAGSGCLRQGSADPTRSANGISIPSRIVSHGLVLSETATTATTPKVVRFMDSTATTRPSLGTDVPPLSPLGNTVSAETHTEGSSDPPKDLTLPGVPSAEPRMSIFYARHDEDVSLQEMAQNFWQTENIGIEKNDPRKEDDLVHERTKLNIRKSDDDEGRYEVRLPWKTPDGEPP